MDGQRARLVTTAHDRLPTIPKARREAPVAGSRLTAVWAAVLGVGWPLAFALALALEPAPADPEAAPAPIAVLASLALLAGLVTTAAAAADRHRGAATAGAVTGLIAVAMTVTCPVSGHHELGLWWVAQLGLVTTMLGASVYARSARATAAD
jgi:hypothetical protein